MYNGQQKQDKGTNKDLQNITQKTKNRATRTTLKAVGDRKYSERVSCSYSTCYTRSVILVTYLVICHDLGKDRIMITINGTYPWHTYGRESNTFEVMTST